MRGLAGPAWGRRIGAALWFLPSLVIDWVRHGDDGPVEAQAVRAAPAPDAYPPTEAMPAAEAVAVPEVAAPAPAKKRRTIRSAISWALYAGFIVGAIVAGPKLLAIALQTDTPLATITSSSMWPDLKRGDLVILKGVDSVDDIKVGEIVAFRTEDEGFVIHRVVQIEGETVTTKGDANVIEDVPWSGDQLIGKVLKVGGRLAKLPYLGSLPLFFQQAGDSEAGQPEAASSEAGS